MAAFERPSPFEISTNAVAGQPIQLIIDLRLGSETMESKTLRRLKRQVKVAIGALG